MIYYCFFYHYQMIMYSTTYMEKSDTIISILSLIWVFLRPRHGISWEIWDLCLLPCLEVIGFAKRFCILKNPGIVYLWRWYSRNKKQSINLGITGFFVTGPMNHGVFLLLEKLFSGISFSVLNDSSGHSLGDSLQNDW